MAPILPPASGGGGFANPMTQPGDIIYGGAAGAGTRLGIGAVGTVLTVPASVNTAIHSDANAGIIAANDTGMPSSADPWTVIWWEKKAAGSDVTPWAWGTTDYGVYSVMGRWNSATSFDVRCDVRPSTSTPWTTPNSADNAWHQFVLTFDGTNYVLYMDGASLGTKASTSLGITLRGDANGFTVGGRFNGSVVSFLFAGAIGRPAVTTLCLTAPAVAALYAAAAGSESAYNAAIVTTSAAIRYYKFTEVSGTAAADSGSEAVAGVYASAIGGADLTSVSGPISGAAVLPEWDAPGGGSVTPANWSSVVTYGPGVIVIGSDSNTYISNVDSNLNNDPTLDTSCSSWFPIQIGNGLAMYGGALVVQPGAWNNGVTYQAGAEVMGSNHHKYSSIVNGANLAHNPVGDSNVHWVRVDTAGDAAWRNLTLINSWIIASSPYNSTDPTAQCMIDSAGNVILRGSIMNNTGSGIAFVLPAGLRPSVKMYYVGYDYENGPFKTTIDTDGSFYIGGGEVDPGGLPLAQYSFNVL